MTSPTGLGTDDWQTTFLAEPPTLPPQVFTAILRDLLVPLRCRVLTPSKPTALGDWAAAIATEM
jgi:hypothetical protein